MIGNGEGGDWSASVRRNTPGTHGKATGCASAAVLQPRRPEASGALGTRQCKAAPWVARGGAKKTQKP